MATVVHWLDRSSDGVYIGRGSPFGNPFYLYRDGDRATVLAKFKVYFNARLRHDPVFWRDVQGLVGHELVCHCKPLDCHGDVIAEYLKRRYYDGS